MINIVDKSKCCGCGACVQRCPKHCITMQEDIEGFLYPVIEESLCIKCGLCEKVCPFLTESYAKKPIKIFAAKNINEQQRLNSSSGGIFILLAEETIKKGGVVFGACFNHNWEVEHCYAQTLEELVPLMRSKYLQSRIGNSYITVETFLKKGQQVLFAGTPCQIRGLHNYLSQNYENLLTIDFVCHGVPSPGIWRRYLEEITTQKKCTVISSITFREKQLNGYDWKNYGFVVRGQILNYSGKDEIILSKNHQDETFMNAFLHELISRPSCFKCPAKDGKSNSDITIGDFWGIEKAMPSFEDKKGVGLLVLHTIKGENIVKDLLLETIKSNYETVCLYNRSYCMAARISKERAIFWETYKKTNSVITSTTKALHISAGKRLLIYINRLIRYILNQ
ncbi:Coenzyme F420 hydrogenase/dehydrogenase, beta subunit C-terminal domain [Bacteroides sp.]|uniref:Coenzyme F420 hydrogenase/dehydrogenase, beta subunit C-terminal domain n=1 Tax=Bacteroides sp. TaxID=29523 RepID=UPI0026355C9A|nr:Coenzyme F420 hydrogenase/dehydrogenase, beta subunit C-terminal domain [Bacteroides sp.]